ncbi:hypothetical protein BC835DRAFT_1415619 [Cytidiella melzeri]|nr:hypothetical protein BC835DRAFT_1415619 [Cytidiella melzeri]
MTTQLPQSLPSFAQTFGPPSLNRLPEVNNALPPIQHRPSPASLDRSRSAHTSPQPTPISEHKQNARKRLHSERTVAESVDTLDPNDRRSPRPVTVKEENDVEIIPTPKHAAPAATAQKGDVSAQTPSTSSSPNPNPTKKRRVTITGIDTDVRRPSADGGISPVVMGLAIPPGDTTALEQVRSMVNLKHQQQALIESRRGSLAGVVPHIIPSDVNIVSTLSASDDRVMSARTIPSVRVSRRSPNLSGHRGSTVSATHPHPTISSDRQRTPPPAVPKTAPVQRSFARPATDSPPTQTFLQVPGSSPRIHPPPAPAHALPTPPISFAHRRASRQVGTGLKGKPADIMISPRSPQESGLQPAIQSAPPIPRGSQTQPLPGRFVPMMLPSVPSVMGSGHPSKRLLPGQVPPTPTRLSMARQAVASATTTGRSPPTASIAIASTLVPPTPASLHHPGYAGEKSAFLAPFESFYDALSDSKQLKTWLGEQLHKSTALITSLQRQQEQTEEAVHHLVDKKMAAMRGEVYDLKMRVDELETQLRSARAQGYSPNLSARSMKEKGKANGYQVSSPAPAPTVPEAYHFPPIDPHRRPELVRRVSSPGSERHPASQTGSPAPFDVGKRLSVSAIRHDSRPESSQSVTRGALSSRVDRDQAHHSPLHSHAHHTSNGSRIGAGGSVGGWSPRASKLSLPTSSARHSLSHSTTVSVSAERSGMPRRSSIDRGSGHHSRHSSATTSRMPHPPEKRRASRSPEADEEGKVVAAPPRQVLEQRRASAGSVQHNDRARSPMDTS